MSPESGRAMAGPPGSLGGNFSSATDITNGERVVGIVSLAFGLTVLTGAYALGPISGGHFNPEGKKHGFDNPEGHHAGDMKNFTVGADGKAKTRVENADATLKQGPHSLSTNGAAVVIHAKGDDYKTDPAGNAGDRIACGVIEKK